MVERSAETLEADSLPKFSKETDLECPHSDYGLAKYMFRLISELAHNLTNKLIHQPTVAIRDASASNRNDLLEFIKDLYELDK